MRLYRSGQLIRPDLQAHIDSEALFHNLDALKSLCNSNTQFCAVVKANAYGHGMTEIVNLIKNDVDFFAVASIYEAIHISYILDKQPVIILEPVNSTQSSEQILTCAEKGFHCVVSSFPSVTFVSNILKDTDLVLNVHINVETGMGRAGLMQENALKAIKAIDHSKNINLAGIFTHFATADEEDLSYVLQQVELFETFLNENRLKDRKDILIHAANSASTIKLPNSHYDMVRCGISLYGYYSRPMKQPPIQLKPVMKLQAPVVQIKHIPAGHSVSYGRSFVTQRDTVTGLIPLGYADGYWRSFSNRAVMKIQGKFAPVIGRVCMDQILIDLTDIPNVEVGQIATLIDNELDSPCGVYALSQLADTICYEILTCVHAHVNRIVH